MGRALLLTPDASDQSRKRLDVERWRQALTELPHPEVTQEMNDEGMAWAETVAGSPGNDRGRPFPDRFEDARQLQRPEGTRRGGAVWAGSLLSAAATAGMCCSKGTPGRAGCDTRRALDLPTAARSIFGMKEKPWFSMHNACTPCATDPNAR